MFARLLYRLTMGIIILLLMVVMMIGCSRAEPVATPDYADAITESVLQAFNAGNYAAYSERFDDAMKETISETVFEGVREFIRDRVGDYISKEATAVQTEGDNTIVTYKAEFTEEPDGVTVNIVFQEMDGTMYVVGLWFDSPKLREI